MNKAQKFILIFIILTLVTLACNSPGNSALSDVDKQATAVAETVAAKLAKSDLLPDENPAAETTATFTPEPSMTTPPTATVTPTFTPTETVISIPCNRASFMSDVTYPDGSEVTINNGFVKTWRLQNTGSCTWTSGYKIIFSHGDRMDAPDEVVLTGGTVAPGQTVDVSVNLTAPGTAGTYKGYFKLKSSDGAVFGIGANGTTPFYVEIKAVPLIFIITPLVLTPLVIITPEASVTYNLQRNCSGKYYLKFRVQNTGTIDIQSYSITAEDLLGNQTTNKSSNGFGSTNTCISILQDPIGPGEVGYVTSGAFDFQMIGSNVTATIKLYPLDDQAGFYTEKTLNFIE
jgi:Ig-like domain from next to BRCA1 gene